MQMAGQLSLNGHSNQFGTESTIMADTHSTRRAHNFKDLLGFVFGRLTVVKFGGFTERTYPSRNRPHRIATWVCCCECGTEVVISSTQLLSKNTRSCQSCKSKIHGMASSREHSIWRSMINRCHNKNDRSYANYGGRGIVVCDRWRSSFVLFIEDIGMRPSAAHTLDRIDNNGPYDPLNCQWSTRKQQARNTRRNNLLTFNGHTRCLSEWAELVGIHRNTLRYRLGLGWTTEQVLTAPLRRNK